MRDFVAVLKIEKLKDGKMGGHFQSTTFVQDRDDNTVLNEGEHWICERRRFLGKNSSTVQALAMVPDTGCEEFVLGVNTSTGLPQLKTAPINGLVPGYEIIYIAKSGDELTPGSMAFNVLGTVACHANGAMILVELDSKKDKIVVPSPATQDRKDRKSKYQNPPSKYARKVHARWAAEMTVA